MDDFQTQFNTAIEAYANKNQFDLSAIPYHVHNGTDTSLISPNNFIPTFVIDKDSATVSFDVTTDNIHTLTLGGNRVLELTGAVQGKVFCMRLIQDGTGSRTVTWFPTIHWVNSVTPTLTTTANHWDTFIFICTKNSVFDGYIAGQNLS